jgi:predicted oxidoreductase
LITNQIELNLCQHQALTDGSIDFLYKEKIKPMIWSPLAGGKIFDSENKLLNEQFKRLVARYQVEADVLALAWLLKHPAGLIPVLGTNKKKRIEASASATRLDLSLQDWFLLYEAALGNEVP